MKHLIFVCLLALISCTQSDDPTPKQTQFDTIVGEWVYQSGDVSGSFVVSKFFDELVVDNVGSFRLKGVQYNISKKSNINFGSVPGTLQSMFLLHSEDTYFAVHECDINNTFTQISCKQYSYGTATTFVIGDKIVLTRK